VSFGLKTLTSFGVNLIDEDFKSLAVVASGSLTTDETGITKIITRAGGVNPILALNCPDPIGILAQGRSGSTFTWQVRSGLISTAVNFDYWVFDNPPNTAPTGMGLVVRNAAGQIAFNSNFKHMRIEDQLFVSGVPDVNSYTPGQTYAVAFANGTLRDTGADLGGSFSNDHFMATAYVDAEDIHTGQLQFDTTTDAVDLSYNPFTTVLVLDVTNY
jgi:hypothetical protein